MVTIQLIPYSKIEGLTSLGRIRMLLNVAKENKIALLQGRLKKEEETELIKATMEEINKEFKGIELAVVNPHTGREVGLTKIKNDLIDAILGDRQGLTIVGPASVVKAIKKDPEKIQLMLSKEKPKRRR